MTPEIHAKLDDFIVEYLTKVSDMARKCHEHNCGGKPSPFRYISAEDFYLREGVPFPHEPLTKDERDSLRNFLPLAKYRTKECYMNASKASLYSKDLVYCEGYAVGNMIPVAHAWVSLNGKPLDLTWPIDFKKIQPPKTIDALLDRIEHNIANCSYFGIAVPKKVLSSHLLETETYCPITENMTIMKNGADWLRGRLP
jgi:hypothetical protein